MLERDIVLKGKDNLRFFIKKNNKTIILIVSQEYLKLIQEESKVFEQALSTEYEDIHLEITCIKDTKIIPEMDASRHNPVCLILNDFDYHRIDELLPKSFSGCQPFYICIVVTEAIIQLRNKRIPEPINCCFLLSFYRKEYIQDILFLSLLGNYFSIISLDVCDVQEVFKNKYILLGKIKWHPAFSPWQVMTKTLLSIPQVILEKEKIRGILISIETDAAIPIEKAKSIFDSFEYVIDDQTCEILKLHILNNEHAVNESNLLILIALEPQ